MQVIGFLENTPSSAVQEKIARDFVPLMIANWKVWPIINLINFKFVPPKLQVLFGNVVSIFCTSHSLAVHACALLRRNARPEAFAHAHSVCFVLSLLACDCCLLHCRDGIRHQDDRRKEVKPARSADSSLFFCRAALSLLFLRLCSLLLSRLQPPGFSNRAFFLLLMLPASASSLSLAYYR